MIEGNKYSNIDFIRITDQYWDKFKMDMYSLILTASKEYIDKLCEACEEALKTGKPISKDLYVSKGI